MKEFAVLEVACWDLIELWQGMPREKNPLVPCKNDLSFRAMAPLASRIYIVEKMDDGSYYMRLSGTEIDAFYKQTLQGTMLSGPAGSSNDNEEIRLFNEEFFAKPVLVVTSEKVSGIGGREALQTTTHLPLADKNGELRFKLSHMKIHMQIPALIAHDFDAHNIQGTLHDQTIVPVQDIPKTRPVGLDD